MSDEDEEFTCTPEEIIAEASKATADILPPKSSELYRKTYEAFQKWKKLKKIPSTSNSESTLLAYFSELSLKLAPPSLWSRFSMLKSTIYLNDGGVQISDYKKLIGFLKRKNDGYQSKKAKVFTGEQCAKFLKEAINDKFLVEKVVMIFGISGAVRVQELTDMCNQHINEEGNLLHVVLPKTKTKVPRSFVIDEENALIVKKYRNLRPSHVPTDRFFLNYRDGKCTRQVIGRNKFLKMPSKIANYLQLPDPDSYTGHSFRRTAASLLANSGANMDRLMTLGGWKSSSTAKGYVENSISYKEKTTNMIKSTMKTTAGSSTNSRPLTTGSLLYPSLPVIFSSTTPTQFNKERETIPTSSSTSSKLYPTSVSSTTSTCSTFDTPNIPIVTKSETFLNDYVNVTTACSTTNTPTSNTPMVTNSEILFNDRHSENFNADETTRFNAPSTSINENHPLYVVEEIEVHPPPTYNSNITSVAPTSNNFNFNNCTVTIITRPN